MGETETQPATGRTPPSHDEAAPRFASDDMIAARYRVIRFLARGGMGEVYEVDDTTLGLRVALKAMRPELARDAAVVRRFRREVELARRVTHAHVCRIFDAGTHDDAPFLTMELVAGETLAARLGREGKLGVDVAAPIVRAMAAALAAAHRAGVIHRDFKTSNVMLEGERVVVTDFGLAHRDAAESDASALTGAAIVGTPGYMAPEQVLGEPTGTAADVYSFGVVLYELVTGELPFRGDSPMATAALRLTAEPRPPRELEPALPDAWQRAILGCLRREPLARLRDLDRVIEVLDGARPRRWWPIAAVAGVLAVAGAALAIALVATRREPPRRPAPAPVMRRAPLADGAPGRYFQATISPDGRRVALADGALRVIDREGAAPRALELPDGAVTQYASWYRDSTRLLVSWIRGDRAELVELDAGGGAPRVVTEGAQGRVSPDGVHLAALRGTDVVLVRLDGAGARTIATVTDGAYQTIAWSQDGRALAILDRAGLRVVAADGSREAAIVPPGPPWAESGVTWLDGGRLVVAAQDPATRDQRLWAIPVDTGRLRARGAPSVLGAFPLQTATALDSGDGARITLSVYNSTADVMALPIPATRSTGTARVLTDRVTQERALGFSADGADVFVTVPGGFGRVAREGGAVRPVWAGPLDGLWLLDDATALRVDGDAVIELSLGGGERGRVTLPPDPAAARRSVQCARADASRCVLGREVGTAIALRAFDRRDGSGAALATVDVAPDGGRWALSPDGASAAVIGGAAGLRVVELSTGAVVARAVPCGVQSVTWLDAARPVVSCMTSDGPAYELRVVEPDGETWPLVSSDDHWVSEPVVDRAGSWIAFSSTDVASHALALSWE